MEQVFNLIFTGLKSCYTILKGFNISAYGFSFSLWDFLLTLFVLSFLVPLVVAPDFSGSFSNFSRGISERINSSKNESKKRSFNDSGSSKVSK